VDASKSNGRPQIDAEKRKLQALMELREQLLELNARLEYLRLMLLLRRPKA
jgi:hypothetical protein